jgi:hypothetical protein
MDIPVAEGRWVDRTLKHDVPSGNRYILHMDIKGENSKWSLSVPVPVLTSCSAPGQNLQPQKLAALSTSQTGRLWDGVIDGDEGPAEF